MAHQFFDKNFANNSNLPYIEQEIDENQVLNNIFHKRDAYIQIYFVFVKSHMLLKRIFTL